MAVVWNIPIANDRSSADFIISSPLMDQKYDRLVPDYSYYKNRPVPGADQIPTLAEAPAAKTISSDPKAKT